MVHSRTLAFHGHAGRLPRLSVGDGGQGFTINPWLCLDSTINVMMLGCCRMVPGLGIAKAFPFLVAWFMDRALGTIVRPYLKTYGKP